jgi:hypothetical protein
MSVSEFILDKEVNKEQDSEEIYKLSKRKEKIEAKVALSHSILTYTSIITGITIIVFLYAALAGFINHTALMLDTLIIIWHIILIARIAVIRRELESIKSEIDDKTSEFNEIKKPIRSNSEENVSFILKTAK